MHKQCAKLQQSQSIELFNQNQKQEQIENFLSGIRNTNQSGKGVLGVESNYGDKVGQQKAHANNLLDDYSDNETNAESFNDNNHQEVQKQSQQQQQKVKIQLSNNNSTVSQKSQAQSKNKKHHQANLKLSQQSEDQKQQSNQSMGNKNEQKQAKSKNQNNSNQALEKQDQQQKVVQNNVLHKFKLTCITNEVDGEDQKILGKRKQKDIKLSFIKNTMNQKNFDYYQLLIRFISKLETIKPDQLKAIKEILNSDDDY
eukprot:403337370